MCHHYRLPANLPAWIRELSGRADMPSASQALSRSAYPLKPVPVLTAERDSLRSLQAKVMEWGLLPSWWKPSEKSLKRQSYQRRCFNARSETAYMLPSYRAAFKRRRCLVPVQSFMEKDHYFSFPDDEPYCFAGLWEEWKGDSETVLSCTILTTAANDAVAAVGHHRMPVLLTDAESAASWLLADTPSVNPEALFMPYGGDLVVTGSRDTLRHMFALYVIGLYNPIMPKRKPTAEAYGELQEAYDFYNRHLFDGKLPGCLITFQRQRHSYGYFSSKRWKSGRACTDEIALNPDYFQDGKRDLTELLSTLVHEMVHLKQHHFGRPGRGRYHNREWGRMMKEVGLYPSETGAKGGKETGDSVSHYILPRGRFHIVTRNLLKTFKISWHDAYAGSPPKGKPQKLKPQPKRPTRQKFSCSGCGLNAWAKYEAPLVCGKCRRKLKPVGIT